MFKVKAVSIELGISEQAVYKKFRNLEEIQKHISLIDGVRCISEGQLVFFTKKCVTSTSNQVIPMNVLFYNSTFIFLYF